MSPQTDGVGAAQSSRLYFLDWIRVLALLAVFLDHAIGGVPGILPSFMPGWGGTLLGVVAALGITLFFTVSGAASIFSLERRSSKQYLRERVVRLAIPFLVGGAVLVPLAQYLGPYPSESSWWEAWRGWAEYERTTLSQEPLDQPIAVYGQWLWVLGFLFLYAVIALPLLQWLRSENADRFIGFTTRLASRRGGVVLWVLPVILLAVAGEYAFIALNIQAEADPVWFIYNGWGAFPRYLGFFVLGAILVRNRDVLKNVQRDWPIALAVLALCLLVVSSLVGFWLAGPDTVVFLLVQAWLTVGSWSLAMVVMAIGQRFWNQQSKTRAYSLGITVAFYVLHVPVIAATLRIFLDWDDEEAASANDFTANIFWDLYSVSSLALGVVVAVVSFVLLIAFIELVIRPIGPLRSLLGVTRDRFPGYNRGTGTTKDVDPATAAKGS
jgi:hypothetical protein